MEGTNIQSLREVCCLFLGNDALHALTQNASCELRIDMEDFENTTKYAVYQNFSVGDRDSGYRLTLGAYSGDAGE